MRAESADVSPRNSPSWRVNRHTFDRMRERVSGRVVTSLHVTDGERRHYLDFPPLFGLTRVNVASVCFMAVNMKKFHEMKGYVHDALKSMMLRASRTLWKFSSWTIFKKSPFIALAVNTN